MFGIRVAFSFVSRQLHEPPEVSYRVLGRGKYRTQRCHCIRRVSKGFRIRTDGENGGTISRPQSCI